jgi:hypothetical protein
MNLALAEDDAYSDVVSVEHLTFLGIASERDIVGDWRTERETGRFTAPTTQEKREQR